MPPLISDIVALPGWNTPMLLLLAKTTLILLAALGITITMQRASAGARHLVWLATLATLIMVPALAAWSPLRLEILPPSQESAESALPHEPLSGATTTSAAREPAPLVATSRTLEPSTTAGPANPLARLRGLPLVFAIWAGVFVMLAGWLGHGALVVRRIVRQSFPLDTQDWLTPLWEVSDRLGLEEPPRLLGSSEARMPFACRFLDPTIVLPAECEGWSADRRHAVLLHELAHVKRRDLVGHTLGRVACALYWFHPLVWTAAKRLRNESERACDDLALSCGARASDYAEHLLDIVTSVRHDSTPAVALAMARRKEFEGRMLAILDPELRHSTPGRTQSVALIGSLALIAIVVGAAAPAPRSTNVTVPVRTAVVAPVIDREFVPQDVARPEEPTDLPIDKPNREKTLYEATDRVSEKMTEKSVEKSTIVSSVADAVASALTGAITGKTLTELAGLDKDSKTAGATDDRPVLLANILRTDQDASLRRVAAWGLSEYAETQVAVDALTYALRRDIDVSVREMAAWALADGRQNSVAIAALAAALRGDASERVRASSAWSLGQVGDRDGVEALAAALADGSKNVRMRAVWAIGQIEPSQAPRALVAVLRDPDSDMRKLAAWALYQIEDPAVVPALNAALQAEQNKDLQIAYIRALAAMGEKSVDAIRGLLSSPDPRIKTIAVRALAGGNATGPWPWPWPEPRPSP